MFFKQESLKLILEKEFPFSTGVNLYNYPISNDLYYPAVIKSHRNFNKNKNYNNNMAVLVGESHALKSITYLPEHYIVFIDITSKPKQEILRQIEGVKSNDYTGYLNNIKNNIKKSPDQKRHSYNLNANEFELLKISLEKKEIIFVNIDLRDEKVTDLFFQIVNKNNIEISFFNFSNTTDRFYVGPKIILSLCKYLKEECNFHVSNPSPVLKYHGYDCNISLYCPDKISFINFLKLKEVNEGILEEEDPMINDSVYLNEKDKDKDKLLSTTNNFI